MIEMNKSGRILNRVIEWDRDGITAEADQRHVREILKDLELERANHSATPCVVERKDEGGARRDESKGENRCGQGQTQIKHERDDMNDGDDRDRLQMADDDVNDSQALTSGDITRYRAHVARITHLSQDRPDLKFASMQVCCAIAKPSVRDMERVKRIGRYLAGKPRAQCWFRWQQSGELEAYSDVDWRVDKATRRSVSAGVIMSGGHCLKVWTKKQQVPRRERAVRRSRNCTRRAWDPERGKGLGDIVWAESTPGCLSNDVFGQPQRIGQSEARHAESVNTRGIQIRQVRHEEGRHEREPSGLNDETAAETEN